jgi:predicted ATPase/DNA-binding winged helix-turn-helix (wHTH) protein
MPSLEARPVYTSGDWEIDLARRELRLRGLAITLGSRAFEIVEVLVQSAGELVDKRHLMHVVWPGATVEENTLQSHISAIRKALGHDRELLKTVPGRGYRLLGRWVIRCDDRATAPKAFEPATAPSQTLLSNLPSSATPLIGRTYAVARLSTLLLANRMVTLAGPGGIGKTVLGLETARTLLPAFAGEIWFVDLAPISNSALVSSTVARALNIRSAGGDISQASLMAAIGTKRVLIVLDNCEHVADAAANVAETILRTCSNVCVLTTTREVLRIEGEVVYRVSPLSVPDKQEDDLDTVMACSAAQLFVERTRALASSFNPGQDNIAAIAAICRRLDGIPLALEIAAARAAVLGLAEVSSRLDGQFGRLAGGRRTALPRHQTLRATLDWSYALLTEVERTVLRRLSIFAGHFTMSSAMKISSDESVNVAEIPDCLASLVMKSLLSVDMRGADMHYRMLQITRDFASDLLRASGEYETLAHCHARHCCEEIENAETESDTLSEDRWRQRYVSYLDDVRAALEWSLERSRNVDLGASLAASAVPIWTRLSLLNECRHFVRSALLQLGRQADAGGRREMKLFAALANVVMNTAGPVPEATQAAMQALGIAERVGDVDFQLRAVLLLWNGCFSNGEIRKSEQLAQQFQRIANVSRDRSDILLGHRLYATTQYVLGNLTQAQTHIEKMIAGYAILPHDSNFARFGIAQLASAHALQLMLLLFRGFPEQAMRKAEECVGEVLELNNALTICNIISSAPILAAMLIGDWRSADRYISIMLDYAVRAELSDWQRMAQYYEAILRIRTGQVGAGLRTLSGIVDDRIDSGNTRYLFIFSEFAEALARTGKVKEGMAVIDNSLRRVQQTEQRLAEPEQLRRKAKLTLMSGGPEATEAASGVLWLALDKCRQQGARFYELRVAVDLAAILEQQDQRQMAQDLLAPVYRSFTEGFNISDLIAARRILDRLGSQS